jgi:hypothetical protein
MKIPDLGAPVGKNAHRINYSSCFFRLGSASARGLSMQLYKDGQAQGKGVNAIPIFKRPAVSACSMPCDKATCVDAQFRPVTPRAKHMLRLPQCIGSQYFARLSGSFYDLYRQIHVFLERRVIIRWFSDQVASNPFNAVFEGRCRR